MHKLVIERSKWYRGQTSKESLLRRAVDSQMCCLGFLCLSYGLTEEQINEEPDPSSIAELASITPAEWLFEFGTDINSDDCSLAMRINDRKAGLPRSEQEEVFIKDEADRERQLTKLFAKHDIQVEFVP